MSNKCACGMKTAEECKKDCAMDNVDKDNR